VERYGEWIPPAASIFSLRSIEANRERKLYDFINQELPGGTGPAELKLVKQRGKFGQRKKQKQSAGVRLIRNVLHFLGHYLTKVCVYTLLAARIYIFSAELAFFPFLRALIFATRLSPSAISLETCNQKVIDFQKPCAQKVQEVFIKPQNLPMPGEIKARNLDAGV
jgi:hypothetical protein